MDCFSLESLRDVWSLMDGQRSRWASSGAVEVLIKTVSYWEEAWVRSNFHQPVAVGGSSAIAFYLPALFGAYSGTASVAIAGLVSLAAIPKPFLGWSKAATDHLVLAKEWRGMGSLVEKLVAEMSSEAFELRQPTDAMARHRELVEVRGKVLEERDQERLDASLRRQFSDEFYDNFKSRYKAT